MLEVSDVHVYRGQTHVLHGVSLKIDRGEIVALIGANGAGKTSLLQTISGLLPIRSGRVHYQPNGKGRKIDISRLSVEEIVNIGVSHCPEGRGIFAQLTVREN